LPELAIWDGSIDMTELFFQYNTIPYLFDNKTLKLFRLENNRMIEIMDREILRKVRLDSIEICRKSAFCQSLKMDKKGL
jgi:hypothetical protein